MEVYVLNTEFNVISVLDSFESLIWTDRYYEAGDFEIYTAATIEMLDILKHDYYLSCNESEHLMVIEGIEISTDLEDGNKLIVTGRSLESILDRRIILGQTNVNDNLQNGVKKILNMNVINPSDETRKINNFIFEDTTDINVQSKFLRTQFNGENLYESIVEICKSMGVGFKVTLNSNRQLVFKLYYGLDRTYNQIKYDNVIFSNSFDNLVNSDYISSKRNFKTVTIVGGEGEGDDRVMIGVSLSTGAEEGLNRRESFTDCHSTSSNSGGITQEEYLMQLLQKGMEDLSDHMVTESFNGEVNNSIFEYGKDYNLGDIVEIDNEYGIVSRPRIIEYIYSQSDSEYKFYPTFAYDEYDSSSFANENKFLVQVYELCSDSYPSPTWCDSHTPILERYYDYDLISTEDHPWGEPEDNYTCRLLQWVYCETEEGCSVTTNVKTDGNGSLYLNNILVSNVSSGSVIAVILNFNHGWNKVEIMYNEITGVDYGYLTTNLSEVEGITHAVPDNRIKV